MRRIIWGMLAVVMLTAGCAERHRLIATAQMPEVDHARWMREARWGIFTHYLADWKTGRKQKMTIEKWNDMVDHFDAEGLADQLSSLGVKYYVLTIGQNSGYYCSPNATYDEIVGIKPSHLSHRDLIADVGAACHARGIHFMVYLPSGAPGGDKTAVAKLEWTNGPVRNYAFQLKWEAVIREWSLRWGDKVEGWWFDGCYFPNSMYRYSDAPNFESFAAAARAGNPHSIVAFNPGPGVRLISPTPYEDYTAGEVTDPKSIIVRRLSDGKLDGVQPHLLTYLGEKWGMGKPRFDTAFLTEWLPRIARTGAAVTFDVPIDINGHLNADFIPQIALIKQTIESTKVVAGSESTTKPAKRAADDDAATEPATQPAP